MKRPIGPVRDASPGVSWSCWVYRGMEVGAVRGHASHEGLSVGYRVLYRVKHGTVGVRGRRVGRGRGSSSTTRAGTRDKGLGSATKAFRQVRPSSGRSSASCSISTDAAWFAMRVCALTHKWSRWVVTGCDAGTEARSTGVMSRPCARREGWGLRQPGTRRHLPSPAQ